MRERGHNGAYFEIEQDALGTYILNARDMNLIEHLPAVIETGVCSLKIEGRMKSIAYVATVVNAYRMALDRYSAAPDEPLPAELSKELDYASHRPYTAGDSHSQAPLKVQPAEVHPARPNSGQGPYDMRLQPLPHKRLISSVLRSSGCTHPFR